MDFKKIIQAVFYGDKWNIGFINQSTDELINTRKLNGITWLKEEKIGFSADPFVVIIDGRVFIYYEFMDFRRGRGTICQISNLDFITRQQVQGFFSSKIHLSYPYIFADEGNIYCIPETAEANEVGLYNVPTSNTTQLSKQRILLSGAPYIDSSIIKFNGRYWLFTSRKDRPGQLFIFYANSLNETFAPHLLNPILCPAQFTRGAGHLFIVNGILYRPTQNSIPEYGRSIIINRINNLTESAFDRETFMEILPDKMYKNGVHTISFADGMIVIDGKRKIYSGFMLLKKLLREFRSFQARLSMINKRHDN